MKTKALHHRPGLALLHSLMAGTASVLATVPLAPFLVLAVLFFTDSSEFHSNANLACILIGWALAALVAGVLLLGFLPMTWLFYRRMQMNYGRHLRLPFFAIAILGGILMQAATYGFDFSESFVVALFIANSTCLLLGALAYTEVLERLIRKSVNQMQADSAPTPAWEEIFG